MKRRGVPVTELRDYQIDTIERTRAVMRRGVRRVLVCAPTGSGKTVIGAEVLKGAVRKGKPSLFAAHRRELIDQCCAKLTEAGILDYGVIMAGDRRVNRDALVQVGSIQTLTRSRLPPASLIMLDEAHRAASPSYVNLAANYPEAYIIGLTATPERMDGKGLDHMFDEMVVVKTVPELIADGFLIKPECYAAPPESLWQLTHVRIRAGDYREDELQEAMDQPKLIGDLVDNWRRLAEGKLTVVFATGVEHAAHIAEEFQRAGIEAGCVTGSMSLAERASVIGDWKSGRLRVMVNCLILIEGFDYPELECCVMARPTKSESLFLQMSGRIMRPADGKAGALLLDHAGNLAQHGLPSIERLWTLEGREKRKRELNEIHCSCGFVYLSEPKLWLSTVQERMETSLLKNSQSKFNQGKQKRALDVCPACSQAECRICEERFVVKLGRLVGEDMKFSEYADCPACKAHYIEELVHEKEGEGGTDLPESLDANLIEVYEEIPIHIAVKNFWVLKKNEGRPKNYKKGWLFHQVAEKFGEDVARRYLPMRGKDWWQEPC
jgi:superfamily II DNA or RNA helicase